MVKPYDPNWNFKEAHKALGVGESIETKMPAPKILNNILEHIGCTPLVRINKVAQEFGVECEVVAKCEFFNAGGSVKDRIGRRMIIDAERSGRIKPGDTLIEPTSGNTGIGLALSAAVKGYKMVITLPEKMSKEKVDVLKGLGAEIIRTPTEAAFDSPESHISVANKLNKEIPNSHILDQYSNPCNPMAHYEGTAEEIYDQCDGKIDMVVIGAGTGGTMTGIATKLKEKIPDIIVVGVDPVGSILAEPESLNDHKRLEAYIVEGIGYDFIPQVLDRKVVDEWIKTEDKESLLMSRKLIREEGLLCGGSCGSAMAGALKAAKRLKKGQRCVVILPDSTRNYMTKFLDEDYMIDHGFMEKKNTELSRHWWSSKTVADLKFSAPITVMPTVSCERTIKLLEKEGIDQLPVISETNEILGVVTLGNLSAKVISGRLSASDPVSKGMFKEFKQVSSSDYLSDVAYKLQKNAFVLVTSTQKVVGDVDEVEERSIVCGMVTSIDLLSFITKGNESN